MSYPFCLDPPRAFGQPVAKGQIRSSAEDFRVYEQVICEPEGNGEHEWLLIQKTDSNTQYVAEQLASFSGVSPRLVSYAGLKDRHAITEQWFSVHLPGKTAPAWGEMNNQCIKVLRSRRHPRKLKRGALTGNQFQIVIRELEGERGAIEERLTRLAENGIPNYFGPQRFGTNGNNLREARQLFENTGARVRRHKRGIYLSAARSMLFNKVLAERVQQGSWCKMLEEDIMQLDGKRGRFLANAEDQDMYARANKMEIHPTGPLWGKVVKDPEFASTSFERKALVDMEFWRHGLESAGMEADRRPLRSPVQNLEWNYLSPDSLELRFSLYAGSYATTLLREVLVH